MHQRLRSNKKIVEDESTQQRRDTIDNNLKSDLANQILHLGGLENTDWQNITSTFEAFYKSIDVHTRTQVYNKFKYWKNHPPRFASFTRPLTPDPKIPQKR